MTLEIAVRVPPCAPIRTLVDLALRMEEGGIDRVSFADSQLLWRDVWATASAAAMATSRIGISVSVTNPTTRHATVTAGAARSIAEIAPGRFILGIGAGDSSVSTIGAPRARTNELRETVTTVKTLVAGGVVDHPVHPWRLHDPMQLPVLLGASGPRNLALAGEVADGVIIPGAGFEGNAAVVRSAAAATGRDPESLQYVMTGACIITTEPERDAAFFKPMCLNLALNVGAAPFEEAGVHIEMPPAGEDFGDLLHPDDWDEAIEVSSRWISDEAAVWFARTRSIFGSPSEVVAKFADLEAGGLRRVLVAVPGAFVLPLKLIDALISDVLPARRSNDPGSESMHQRPDREETS